MPKIVPSIAANELFQHIADKIIKDSERFDMFSNKKTNMEELFETNYILSCRAYHRYKHLYSNSALLMSFYKTLMNPEFLPKIAFDTKNEWIHESIKNSRYLFDFAREKFNYKMHLLDIGGGFPGKEYFFLILGDFFRLIVS